MSKNLNGVPLSLIQDLNIIVLQPAIVIFSSLELAQGELLGSLNVRLSTFVC
jgi:hypothetical protein